MARVTPTDRPAAVHDTKLNKSGGGRTQDPADGLPRDVRAARATVPGRPSLSGPLEGEGGKTSAAALDLALGAAADPDREAGRVPAGRSSLPGPACLQPAGPGTSSPAPGGRRRAAGASGAGSNPIAAAMSEDRGPDSLDAHVRRMFKDLGLMAYHTRTSIGSAKGYPDWTIAGPGGQMWRELKTQRGKVTAEQQAWLDALAAGGGNAAVWRPEHLLSGQIASELTAISALKVATA